MSITEEIQRDVIIAMKAKDKERLTALRMLLSGLKLGAKEAPGEFGEEQELAVLATEKKRRQQAAEAFRAGGREDRAQQEEAEITIIDSYLPQAMSEAELAAIIEEVVGQTGASGPRDMGKVMGQLMPRVAGRADGKLLSEMVKRRLAG